jgi:hypothetical protein
MYTDFWQKKQKLFYANLIEVEVVQCEQVPTWRRRQQFFQKSNSRELAKRDIFLDPDTGISIKRRGNRRKKYVFGEEILDNFLSRRSKRAIVIYDHSLDHGVETKAEVKRKIRALRKKNRDLYAFAYCAQVAIVVLSRSPTRIKELRKKAKQMGLPEKYVLAIYS